MKTTDVIADLAARRVAVRCVRIGKPIDASAIIDAIRACAWETGHGNLATADYTPDHPMVLAARALVPEHAAAVVVYDEHLRQLREQQIPELAAAWFAADTNRRVRALINAGPRAIATIEVFLARIETGTTEPFRAPKVDIANADDPRMPGWAATITDRLSRLDGTRFAEVLRLMHPESMRHMTVDLQQDGWVGRIVQPFATPDEAEAWLSQVPSGFRALHSHVQDLRAFPHPRVLAHVTLAAATV